LSNSGHSSPRFSRAQDDSSYGSHQELGNQDKFDRDRKPARDGDSALFGFTDCIQSDAVRFRNDPSRHRERGRFPGLVLRTSDETLHVTLMDRNPKKIVFLKHAARELKLTGVNFINMSLKDLLVNPSGSRFDHVVSRGFSSNITLLDGVHSLLAPKGCLITMAGPSSEKLALENFRLAKSWEGILPFSNRFRKVSLHQLN